MRRVKFITKNHGAGDWLRQIAGGQGVVADCEFVFGSDCEDYDWLVVYDDFPKRRLDGSKYDQERLACAPECTVLVTSEPESIKHYARAYTEQFGWVLTSQSERALPHRGAIRGPSTSLWYYGQGGDSRLTVDDLQKGIPEKTADISTVCSQKQQKHTLHYQRWQFTQALKKEIPELEIFGHGVRPVRDKAEAMRDYRYHIAIENYLGADHWTEKLSDCFLAGCLPFYHGCPNAEDYFPEDSFIRIDLNDVPRAVATIREAIRSDAYSMRLNALKEARRRVMEEHNLFVRLSRLIEQSDLSAIESTDAKARPLYCRKKARLKRPFRSALDAIVCKLRS